MNQVACSLALRGEGDGQSGLHGKMLLHVGRERRSQHKMRRDDQSFMPLMTMTVGRLSSSWREVYRVETSIARDPIKRNSKEKEKEANSKI